MIPKSGNIVNDENGVSSLYKNGSVAAAYVEKRLRFSWQRLLHKMQISAINQVVRQYQPQTVLEVAPGPARLTVDVEGIKRGFLVEYSEEMLKIARQRLMARGRDQAWTLIHANAFELTEIKDLPSVINFIYTFRFIRHFHEKDRARLYKVIHTKLPRGGLLMFDVVNQVLRERLDAKVSTPSKDSLPVYDATYTIHQFKYEMKNNGFDVISMTPVINHFPLQSWLSYKLDDIMPNFIRLTVNLIEKIPSKNPLEWIALCQAK
ncbi:class I SAM-dependent methyltransferase [Desulfovulcanus sp.]